MDDNFLRGLFNGKKPIGKEADINIPPNEADVGSGKILGSTEDPERSQIIAGAGVAKGDPGAPNAGFTDKTRKGPEIPVYPTGGDDASTTIDEAHKIAHGDDSPEALKD